MTKRAGSTKPPRTRRSAEEARAAILDAAEQRVIAAGPSGLRLKEVAEDVGIAHPTILHHFGSRERLLRAVLERRIEAMNADILGTIAKGAFDEEGLRTLLERLALTFGPEGHARFVAFVALDDTLELGLDGVRPLAAATHAQRLALLGSRGEPSPEDSYFAVLLVAFALFGDAIVGRMFRGEPKDSDDPETSARFRAWLTKLLRAHLFEGGPP